MCAVVIYRPDDEGNLIFLAEDEDSDDVTMTLDEFLIACEDDEDRVQLYLALVGDVESDEGATAVVAEVDLDEPVGPRHSITVSSNYGLAEKADAPAPKRRGRPPKVQEADKSDEVEQSVPKRRGRPPGSKNKPGAKKPGPKPKDVKKPARKGGIKVNTASEE